MRRLNLPGEYLSEEDQVRAAWPQAVGKRIASHTRPVSLADSRLIVEVEDEVWQDQLKTLGGQILAKLREIAGKETVAFIEFRRGVPRIEPQRAEQVRPSQDEAERIEDPVLRRLYRASRKRSTG